MPTECSPTLVAFAPVENRRVVAGFDGGAITSNAGALLLGATYRAIGLVRRFAACFRDARAPRSEEHTSELQSRQYLVCRLLLGQKDRLALPGGWRGTGRERAPAGCVGLHPRPGGRAAPVRGRT